MKAVQWIAIFIAITCVSSALACGNSNISTSDEAARQSAIRQADMTLIQATSIESTSTTATR